MSDAPGPLMDWDSTEKFSAQVVWWAQGKNGRYQFEVHRKEDDPQQGVLRVFDHTNDNAFVGERDCSKLDLDADGRPTKAQVKLFAGLSAIVINGLRPRGPRQYAVLVAMLDGSGSDAIANTLIFGPYSKADANTLSDQLNDAIRRTGEDSEVEVGPWVLADLDLQIDLQKSVFDQLYDHATAQEEQ